MNTPINEAVERGLLDEDGENRALRTFLMLYGGANSVTVGRMRKHMDLSGWPLQFCPDFARTGSEDNDHLTKAGAQIWIRHLLSMESRAALPPPIVEPVLWVESEPSTRLLDLQEVINGTCHTVLYHTTAPRTNNPVWPLYTTPASAPSDVAADARDGERYRWLKQCSWFIGEDTGGYFRSYKGELDAAIDAAIASTHTTTGGEEP